MSAPLRPGDAVGVLACSDAVPSLDRLHSFCGALEGMGLRPRLAGTLERRLDAERAGADARPSAPALPPAPERAAELMGFYADADVRAVFDVSGGDLSNELLDRIDYAFLAAHPKPLVGYMPAPARPPYSTRPSTWSAGTARASRPCSGRRFCAAGTGCFRRPYPFSPGSACPGPQWAGTCAVF